MYRYIIHKCTALHAPRFYATIRAWNHIRPRANRTYCTRNIYVSAGRYIEGTIPDWLIRGLDDLGGWSIAKLIQVVLPYLYVSWQMMSGRFREAVRSLENPCAPVESLVRLILGYTTLRPFSFLPSTLMKVNRDTINLRFSLSTKELVEILFSRFQR